MTARSGTRRGFPQGDRYRQSPPPRRPRPRPRRVSRQPRAPVPRFASPPPQVIRRAPVNAPLAVSATLALATVFIKTEVPILPQAPGWKWDYTPAWQLPPGWQGWLDDFFLTSTGDWINTTPGQSPYTGVKNSPTISTYLSRHYQSAVGPRQIIYTGAKRLTGSDPLPVTDPLPRAFAPTEVPIPGVLDAPPGTVSPDDPLPFRKPGRGHTPPPPPRLPGNRPPAFFTPYGPDGGLPPLGDIPSVFMPPIVAPDSGVGGGNSPPNNPEVPVRLKTKVEQKPSRREKEKKARSKTAVAAWAALGFLTESIDLARALIKALPAEIRNQMRGMRMNERIELLYRHLDQVDIEQAILEFVLMTVEDAIYAIEGKPYDAASRRFGQITGRIPGVSYQYTRQFGDIDIPGVEGHGPASLLVDWLDLRPAVRAVLMQDRSALHKWIMERLASLE